MSDIYKADISKFVVTGFPVTDVFYADNKKRTNIDKELKNYVSHGLNIQILAHLLSFLKISFNSPVVLGFTVVCFGALILSMMTGGKRRG